MIRTPLGLACICTAMLMVCGVAVADVPESWRPFAEASVIEILTQDEGGAPRETQIWIVVLDDTGFVRTNDSRWLANIRRGSEVALRVGEIRVPVRTEEVQDPALKARVEEAFKTKYGTMQRIMSALRMREPSVLRVQHRDAP